MTSGRWRIERLVALALQPAVVLRGEVELLERGAHAAVEDDDAAADGLEVVAHATANATSDRPTLTSSWQLCAARDHRMRTAA